MVTGAIALGTLRKIIGQFTMRRHLAKGSIRPKISTMPRQKSEAAAFLDIYKLVIEKKRLKEELLSIEERRQQIQSRLEVLDRQVADLEDTVGHMRAAENEPQRPRLTVEVPTPTLENFETLFLDY